MTNNVKESILKKLAKTEGIDAESALNKEADKILVTLTTSSNFDELEDALTYLELFSYRVADKAVTAANALILRIQELNLTYQDLDGYPTDLRAKYHGKDQLISLALKTLEKIAYHQPDRVFNIAYSLIDHSSEQVAYQAKSIITDYAKYSIELFYGDGKTWGGLGTQPQEKLLEALDRIPIEERTRRYEFITELCRSLLSMEMSGTKWTYDKVVLRTGNLPNSSEVVAVRNHALNLLKDLFKRVDSPIKRKNILGALLSATYAPHRNYTDDILQLITTNTIDILNFLILAMPSMELEILEALENDAFHLFKRYSNPQIDILALEIKAKLDRNEEYQIFKNLIGFEGVFSEWTREEGHERDYSEEIKFRETNAYNYVQSINENNYNEWEHRIITYAKIESNDMATFPNFGKFLELFGRHKPDFSFRFLKTNSQNLERFLVAIMMGLWETDSKSNLKNLLNLWISEGLHLYSIVRFTGFMKPFDPTILKSAYSEVIKRKDNDSLTQVIAAIANQVASIDPAIISEVFTPAIKTLSQNSISYWIHDFWFRKEKISLFKLMNKEDYEAILENMIHLPKISYEGEAILSEIAKKEPLPVINYFCQRINKMKGADADLSNLLEKYEAIPYQFHELSPALSKIPKQAVDIVFENFDGNYGMFMFRGAKLLANIFTEFPSAFEEKLREIASNTSEKSVLFVLAILRGYDGDTKIYECAKYLVKILPIDSEYHNEIMIALESTGVVAGEFGFSNAYKQKLLAIQPWLIDENENVRKFAKNYCDMLEKQIEFETKRAEESILLRKHEYGTDEEDDVN